MDERVLLTNGTLKAPRKRVLSERGEAEARYPVVDKRTLFNSWRGSHSHNCFVCAMGEHVRRAITSSGPFKAQWIQPYLKKIFPSHRPGYQEDAHELLTLILDALDSNPPAAAKQQNGPPTNTSNQFRLLVFGSWKGILQLDFWDDKDGANMCNIYAMLIPALARFNGVFNLVKGGGKTEACLLLWIIVRIILQMCQVS
uniref:Uncharacterized protein n=1 Tax=Parascaris equorum TaxID=6256 RepID=A0A914SIP5_PAREQ